MLVCTHFQQQAEMIDWEHALPWEEVGTEWELVKEALLQGPTIRARFVSSTFPTATSTSVCPAHKVLKQVQDAHIFEYFKNMTFLECVLDRPLVSKADSSW